MNFYRLLQDLEERLGYHQLPLNAGASGLRDILDGTPLHHEWMVRFVRAIYAENRCRKLDDPVSPAETFKSLADLRGHALRAANTDVDLHGLVEDIGEALKEIFAEDSSKTTTAARPETSADAEIIPFESRRRLKTSA